MRSINLYQDLINLLQNGWAGLPDKPLETPQTTLEALWRCSNGQEYRSDGEISSEEARKLRELVDQRLNGSPLAYLTGRQSFMGIDFLSSPEAMIPRKETEILGRASVELARQLAEDNKSIRIIDLCTGSGNIALTLAYYVLDSQVDGADLSEEAVMLARRNAQHLGLADRSRFFQGDLFAPFENDEFLGKMDLVTCNPPYISSAHVEKLPGEIIQHEPRLAFDGGPFGIRILTRLVRESPRFLKPEGWLCFEVGLGQGNAMLNMVNKANLFIDIEPFRDNYGEIRVLQARYHP